MPDIKKKSGEGESPEENPWANRIAKMKKHQEDHSQTWKRNTQLMFGATEAGEKENQVAYGWSLVKSLETSIYVTNPDMVAEAYSDAKQELGRILTSIANYDIDTMDLKTVGNIGLIDVFTCGYCAVIEALETDKRYVEDKEAKEGENVDVSAQRYTVRRIDPKDLLIPRGTRLLDLSDAPYIAVAFFPTIEELRKIEGLKLPKDIETVAPDAEDLVSEKPAAIAKAGDRTGQPGIEKDPQFKRILCWEIYDKLNRKIHYMLGYNKKVVGELEWPARFKIGGREMYPITVMAMNPVPGQWYAKPEMDLIAPQLMMLNKMDAMIFRNALEKWRKWVGWADIVPPDVAAKIQDMSVENAVILLDPSQIDKLTGGGQSHEIPSAEKAIVPLMNPQPERDLLAVRELVKQEISDILGYGPPASGGMPKTRSAREAVAIKERMEQRLSKRADAVGDFYRSFGQKHILFLQQTMVIDRYVRIFSNAQDLVQWRQYGAEDIDGDFNFIVHAGTSAPRTTEAYRASEMQLFQTLTPLIQNGMIPIEPVILRLANSMQWRGVDALLRNYKPAVEQLAMVLLAMKSQPNIPPQALPEAAAAVVQAVMTPEQLGMLAQRIQQGAAQAGGGPGPPAQKTAVGQRGDTRPANTETATM